MPSLPRGLVPGILLFACLLHSAARASTPEKVAALETELQRAQADVQTKLTELDAAEAAVRAAGAAGDAAASAAAKNRLKGAKQAAQNAKTTRADIADKLAAARKDLGVPGSPPSASDPGPTTSPSDADEFVGHWTGFLNNGKKTKAMNVVIDHSGFDYSINLGDGGARTCKNRGGTLSVTLKDDWFTWTFNFTRRGESLQMEMVSVKNGARTLVPLYRKK